MRIDGRICVLGYTSATASDSTGQHRIVEIFKSKELTVIVDSGRIKKESKGDEGDSREGNISVKRNKGARRISVFGGCGC
jgi:hypothetical protein